MSFLCLQKFKERLVEPNFGTVVLLLRCCDPIILFYFLPLCLLIIINASAEEIFYLLFNVKKRLIGEVPHYNRGNSSYPSFFV